MGTTGEIEGFLEEKKFVVRKYEPDTLGYTERTVEISEDVSGAHSGGDLRLAEDFVSAVLKQPKSVSCTDIDDSISGHLAVIAAEQSRKTDKTVYLDTLVD